MALVFIISIIGTLLPILPGTLIAFCGVLLHKLIMQDASVSWWFVGVSFILVVASIVLDWVATWWGARRFGASWQGALGALVGGIVGAIFFNLPGIILGPVVGAFLFEWIHRRNSRDATRAGFGTLVGGLLAMSVKFAMTMGIAVGFFFALP